MPFRIIALDPAPFAALHHLSDTELTKRNARRVVATSDPGFPCRVSLVDAAVGQTLILTHFTHQPAATPFHASHAVYVRAGAVRATPAVDEVPALFAHRMMSLRAFDFEGMMVDATVVPGADIAPAIDAMLATDAVDELHLHYAGPGCYAARAVRAA